MFAWVGRFAGTSQRGRWAPSEPERRCLAGIPSARCHEQRSERQGTRMRAALLPETCYAASPVAQSSNRLARVGAASADASASSGISSPLPWLFHSACSTSPVSIHPSPEPHSSQHLPSSRPSASPAPGGPLGSHCPVWKSADHVVLALALSPALSISTPLNSAPRDGAEACPSGDAAS